MNKVVKTEGKSKVKKYGGAVWTISITGSRSDEGLFLRVSCGPGMWNYGRCAEMTGITQEHTTEEIA